jgi:hypothetical protein
MIRLEYEPHLPMLACVAQEGDDVVIAVNQYAQMLLDFDARKRLFNDLMRGLETTPPDGEAVLTVRGLHGPNVVVRLDDVRLRREIALVLAEGFAINQ